MRRILLTILSTVAGIVLLLSLKPHQGSPADTTQSPAGSAAPDTVTGEFTGDVVDTRYGPVQVSVTFDHGTITAVDALQTPSDSGRDREIAGFAVPELTREALAAQNANIDTVSGATYTSEGYIESLQSALDSAHV